MKIICLANSYRVGGRCLGGIELGNNNAPVIINGRPKWVRPVCNTEHEEVPTELVSDVSLLDVIEFNNIRATGHGHQSENILFEENSINAIGTFNINALANLTDNNRHGQIFSNGGAAVPAHLVDALTHSLMLVELTEFAVNERVFEGRAYPQKKLTFRYNNHQYNFPITDPVFQHRYSTNHGILDGKEKIFVSLSLAAPHEDWSSKLVAGIIY